jgi:hypothetical protein
LTLFFAPLPSPRGIRSWSSTITASTFCILITRPFFPTSIMLTVAAAAALILPGLALAAPLVARQAEGQFIRFQTTDIVGPPPSTASSPSERDPTDPSLPIQCLTVQPGVNGRFSDGNAVISAKCGEGPFSLNGPTQNWVRRPPGFPSHPPSAHTGLSRRSLSTAEPALFVLPAPTSASTPVPTRATTSA